MDTIEFKDLLVKFTQEPLGTIGYTLHLVTTNAWENKFRIIILFLLVYLLRLAIFKGISLMVPTENTKYSHVGHILRKLFLRRVTDNDGRLLRRPARWFRRNQNQRFFSSLPLDKYSELKDENYYSRRRERAAGTASLLKSMANFVISFFAILIFMNQLGIRVGAGTTGLLLGFISIASALGIQNILKDVLAGFHVLAEDQYGLGDYIDAQNGVEGVVTHIGLRTTRLKSNDGTVYHVRHSEVSSLGNKTQSAGNLLVDVEFTWNSDEYKNKAMIDIQDYHFVEHKLMTTVKDLKSTLDAVDRVRFNQSQPQTNVVPLQHVAKIVPSLVSTLTDDTLVNLRTIATAEQTEMLPAREQIIQAVNKLEDRSKPIFKNVELLGLINSEAKSLTIRVKISLHNRSSLDKALTLLRAQVFEEFSQHEISVKFSEVKSTGLNF